MAWYEGVFAGAASSLAGVLIGADDDTFWGSSVGKACGSGLAGELACDSAWPLGG
jgi:hypothetical protein